MSKMIVSISFLHVSCDQHVLSLYGQSVNPNNTGRSKVFPLADPGFEEGGFQVCGQSPHGCRRQ